MAVFGSPLFDQGCANATARTTTSQYVPVYLSAANEYSVVLTTTQFGVGICATEMESTREVMGVATHGKFKAKCAVSVTAGELVYPNGADVLGIKSVAYAATTTSMGAIGRALESGSTNTVIGVVLGMGV